MTALSDSARAHLLHVFPSFEVGGIQVRTSTIINSLEDRFRHTIVALDGNYACAERLSTRSAPRLLRETEPAHSLFRSISVARETLRREMPDVLLTYNWAALDWALTNGILTRCRHVHHEDGFNLDEADRQLRRRITYRRLSLLGNDVLIVPSHGLHEIALHVWRRPESRVRLIPNGVRWQDFQTVQPASGENVTVVGTVAPLRPEKNIDALLRAVAVLRTRHAVELVVVGDGPERRRLQALADTMGLTDVCRFLGLRHDLAEALAPIEIFMMSSKTEQMPMSLLQAMASAKPVVAYGVGDIREMTSDENKPYVVPRDDEEALARCTETLIDDADLRRRIGYSNLARVKRDFTASNMIAAYEDCYLAMAGGKR